MIIYKFQNNNCTIKLIQDSTLGLIIEYSTLSYPYSRKFRSISQDKVEFIFQCTDIDLITALKKSELFNFYINDMNHTIFTLNSVGRLLIL